MRITRLQTQMKAAAETLENHPDCDKMIMFLDCRRAYVR
jgi:hypothetical protein